MAVRITHGIEGMNPNSPITKTLAFLAYDPAPAYMLAGVAFAVAYATLGSDGVLSFISTVCGWIAHGMGRHRMRVLMGGLIEYFLTTHHRPDGNKQ